MKKSFFVALPLSLLLGFGAAQAHFQILSLSPLEPTSQFKKINPVVLKQDFSGSVVCAQEDAKYTSAGFNWPWENVLTIRGPNSNIVRSVSTPKHNFVFNPRWMPGGRVIFEYGPDSESWSLYSVALWDGSGSPTTATTLVSGLSWKIVQPSPSGRFLAFVRGGQPIPGRGGATPASLCTLDLQTKVEKRWGKGEPMFTSVAWANDDTVLFSLVPSEAERRAIRMADATGKPSQWQPAIYAATLSTEQVRPLVQGAIQPAPSPDGKWLLSLSYNNPSSVKDEAPTIQPDPTLLQAKVVGTLFLVLSRADGSEPRLVCREEQGAPNIVWFPDSSGFALCDTRLAGGTEEKSALSVAVNRYEVATAKLTRVGSFRYIAQAGTNMSEDARLWRPIAVTRDNRYLMSELSQYENVPDSGLMLQRFDLQTGKTQIVAHIDSVRGLDWRE